MQTFSAYFNGAWIDDSELKVSVDDVGFLLGATVTERLRTFRGKVFRLEQHLQRMRHSLEIIGLQSTDVLGQIETAIPAFVERHANRIDPADDWSIVAFATPGRSGSGQPTVCVHGYPLPFHHWAEHYDDGVAVVVSDIRQVPATCWPPELKCRSRMHYYLADRQAAAARPGARAILLDQNGFVAEATTANVLVYRADEGLLSPPEDNILAGVSLGVVEELSERLRMPMIRRNLTVDDLTAADELMLASTSVCLLPIVECNGRQVGSGACGPNYQRLLASWRELVGVDVKSQARQFATRAL